MGHTILHLLEEEINQTRSTVRIDSEGYVLETTPRQSSDRRIIGYFNPKSSPTHPVGDPRRSQLLSSFTNTPTVGLTPVYAEISSPTGRPEFNVFQTTRKWIESIEHVQD